MTSQTSRNQGFSYYFCLMIEGSGSIPLTNGYGSGSRRPKIIRIRRIRSVGVINHAGNEHTLQAQGWMRLPASSRSES
jgi:hypothetical protein